MPRKATTTKSAQKAAANGSNTGPAKRKRADQPVYFACKTGNFVLQSPDHKLHVMENGKSYKAKDEGIIIWFTNGMGYHTGVSRAYDPTKPEDKAIIDLARDTIAAGEDDRVRINNFREHDPFAPRAPFTKWDDTSPHRILEIVRDTGMDIEACLAYERYYEARPELVAGLEALRDESVPEDPLMVPEL